MTLFIIALVVVSVILLIYYFNNQQNRNRKVFIADYERNIINPENIQVKTSGDYFMRGYSRDIARKNNSTLGNLEDREVDALIERDYHLALALYVDAADPILEIAGLTNNFMAEHIDQTIDTSLQRKIGKDLKNKTNTESRNKLESTHKFIAESSTFSNDAQNVHDSNVTSHTKEVYLDLATTEPENIQNDSVGDIIDKLRKTKAANSVNYLKSEIYNMDVNEQRLLQLVWNRSYHPNNQINRECIQDSIIDHVADCVENGFPVCVTGRAARLVDSLTLLDFKHGAVKTHDMYKSEIFNDVKNIIDKEVEDNLMSEKFGNVAKSYKDPTVEYDDADEDEFRKLLADKITTHIDEKYEDVANISKIKEEALLAI